VPFSYLRGIGRERIGVDDILAHLHRPFQGEVDFQHVFDAQKALSGNLQLVFFDTAIEYPDRDVILLGYVFSPFHIYKVRELGRNFHFSSMGMIDDCVSHGG
jgi:hypothetical protein